MRIMLSLQCRQNAIYWLRAHNMWRRPIKLRLEPKKQLQLCPLHPARPCQLSSLYTSIMKCCTASWFSSLSKQVCRLHHAARVSIRHSVGGARAGMASRGRTQLYSHVKTPGCEHRPSRTDWHGMRLARTRETLSAARMSPEPSIRGAPELEQLHGRLRAMLGAAPSPLHKLSFSPPYGPQLLPQLCTAQRAYRHHAVASAEHSSVLD